MKQSHPARRLGAVLRSWAAAAFTLQTRSLAAFRIATGLILVADALLRTRDFGLMFTPDGMFPPQLVREFYGDPTMWSLIFLTDAAWWGGVVLALEGVAGALLLVGLWTRPATILAWVAVVSVIRRTGPATNNGDIWLACNLFWSLFLPLGQRWSLDALRHRGRPAADAACSVATAALVLQLAAVYLGAGLAKCNGSWFSGEAVAHALSVHDHGTPIGMAVAGLEWLTRPATWGVLLLEIGGPLALVLLPGPRIRGGIAATFILFHAAIWLGMTVGLFAAVGIAAWLPVLPAGVWPGRALAARPRVVTLGRPATAVCGLALALSVLQFVHEVTRPPLALPRVVAGALNAVCLPQQWAMFAFVPAQEQWVFARAELADGEIVDLLRGGRSFEPDRPAGGFTSLPHHRWHKFLWVLPGGAVRCFAMPAAKALVRDWNRRQPPERQVRTLEIRFELQSSEPGDDTRRSMLVAAWPARSPTGAGNLDRLLGTLPPEAGPAAGGAP